MEQKKLINRRLIVTSGDITQMTTDAVVNAANSSLMGGGGVDGAIHRAGGPSILAECKKIRQERYPNGLRAGEAVATGAGNLPARYIIHTVGPVWHGGGSGEADILSKCYSRSLAEAAGLGLKTIAFPAISTGIYGYPKENAARVAYDAVKEYLQHSDIPQTVYFVFYSPGDAEIFLNAIGEA